MQNLMSGWPRRKQSLLDVGCGTGYFLQSFWESGFDVTGFDASPAMLARARSRLGSVADYQLGQADNLPYDDREFDFVTLLTVLEFATDAVSVLNEASRVARKAVIISFLNRFSIYYLTHGRASKSSRSMLTRANWFTLFGMRRMVRTHLGPRPTTARSVLPGPMTTWSNHVPWRWLNARIYPPLCGAYIGLRVDLVGEKVCTPLLAWKTEPKATP